MAKDRDERVATLIFGSVNSLESNLTQFLAEAPPEEVEVLATRLTELSDIASALAAGAVES